MINWIYAALICVAVFIYWIICRKNALKHQEAVADLIEKHFADDNISEREKSKMYVNYRLFRSWFALPVMLLAAPFFLIFAFTKKFQQSEFSENSKEFDEVFNCLMKMYMAKNPILSTVFMSIMGVVFAVALVISAVLNKASRLPSFYVLSSQLISKLISLQIKFRHVH